MRSAARPEGRGDADRGPLQALNPTSGRDSRRTSPLSNEGLAVCVSFRQFSVLLVETQQFHWIACCAPTSMKLADAAVGTGRVFLAWKAPSARFAGRTWRAVQPRPHPGHTGDGVRRA